MPHFTLAVTPNGPILDLLIGVSQARQQALRHAGEPIPLPVAIRGLIDTGASCTCVDPGAIASLGLSPTGMTSMLTPSTGATPHQANTYDVGVVIPCLGSAPFVIGNLAITESALAVQGIQALIGRDLLNRCLFIYNGQNGFFTLAY